MVGKTLDNRYKLEKKIGSGGHGRCLYGYRFIT